MFHVKHEQSGDNMSEKYMKMALLEAKKAYNIDEIPVGCIILKDNVVIGKGYNCKESKKSPLMHAELIAIEEACGKLNSWRLDDCVMYVTLEPCMMCMGAIIESRIKTVYYGTKNKSEQMYDFDKISKGIELIDVKDVDCSKILSDFFKNKRKK